MAGLDLLFLDDLQPIGAQYLLVANEEGVGFLLRQEIVVALADQFLAGNAEQFLAGTVHQDIAVLARLLDEQHGRHVFNDGVEKLPGAAQFVICPLPLGDVDEGHHPGWPPLILQELAIGGDVDLAAIRLDVAPDAVSGGVPVICRDHVAQEVGVVSGPDVEQRHRQELLARVAIVLDRGLVDRQKPQTLQLEYPHRQGIAVEQQARGCLALLQLADIGDAADDKAGAIGEARPLLARHDGPDLAVGAWNEFLVLIDFARLQHQPVDPLEDVGMLLRHEGVIGLADQSFMRMTHELAHAAVQHHEAQLVVLDENRLRDGVENAAQGIEVLERHLLRHFVGNDAFRSHDSSQPGIVETVNDSQQSIEESLRCKGMPPGMRPPCTSQPQVSNASGNRGGRLQ